MNKKLGIVISIIILLFLGITIYYINHQNIKKEFIVRVIESNSKSSLVEAINSKEKDNVLEINVGDLMEGDILKISYDDEIIDSYPKLVLVTNYKYVKHNETTTTTTTTITTTTTTNKIISNNDKQISKDNIVLTKLESNVKNIEENLNNGSYKEKAKEYFINAVDFIFYDKDIKGVYFKDLTAKAKLKTIELALKLDILIDKHYPSYKENISDKYQNIKSKLITLYLDKTSEYCQNNLSVCDEAKTDFALFKKAYGITWDFIKDLGTKGFSKLKDWYEIYSDKRD